METGYRITLQEVMIDFNPKAGLKTESNHLSLFAWGTDSSSPTRLQPQAVSQALSS